MTIIFSTEDYEHLEQLEDQIWAVKAKLAEKSGFLSERESEKFLDGLVMHRKAR